MDTVNASDRIRDLYLAGVIPNGKDIGVGAYGKVFEVECCGTVYAAKEIHSILVQGVRREESETMHKAFLTGCIRSGSLSHPNIVHFLGVYNPGGHSLLPIVVMERMQESLTSVVEKYPNIPMHVKLSMLLDVSRGLWYLHIHHPPIVHGDLSPNNVLLTSQFVAKISDLGVAKLIQADRKKTKTRAPGTVDFMPPEALLKTPEYGPPLDIFSYGGVILHTVNQEWPEPLHYVMTDPKTGKITGLSEVERRQHYMEKMTGTPVDLRSLVEQCLDNLPSKRPLISIVSERMKKMKEAESKKCPNVHMNPITWQQVEQTTEMFKEATITTPTDEVQQPTQVDIFSETVKWKELAALPVCRTAHTAVLLKGNIYVGGGLEGANSNDQVNSCRLDVYNLTTNQWSSSPITAPYYWSAMTVLDDKLIIAGGETKNDEVVKKVLVLNAGQWKDLSEMPTARSYATAVGYHSMLIVVGGQIKVKGEWTRSSATEMLDTVSGCWHTCSNLPCPHQRMKAAILNDQLYLLSGVDQDLKLSTQVFVASLDTISTHQLNWQSAPNTPWCSSAPVVLYKQFLLTLGGCHQSRTSEVNIFSPSNLHYKCLANTRIPAPRSSSAVVSLADNITVVIGGTTDNGKRTKKTWIGTFE